MSGGGGTSVPREPPGRPTNATYGPVISGTYSGMFFDKILIDRTGGRMTRSRKRLLLAFVTISTICLVGSSALARETCLGKAARLLHKAADAKGNFAAEPAKAKADFLSAIRDLSRTLSQCPPKTDRDRIVFNHLVDGRDSCVVGAFFLYLKDSDWRRQRDALLALNMDELKLIFPVDPLLPTDLLLKDGENFTIGISDDVWRALRSVQERHREAADIYWELRENESEEVFLKRLHDDFQVTSGIIAEVRADGTHPKTATTLETICNGLRDSLQGQSVQVVNRYWWNSTLMIPYNYWK
jgi:hypothetical protein